MIDWKARLSLREGEMLRLDDSKSEGFMQETDVDTYSIVDNAGHVTGTVKVTDHTAVKGFKRSIRVVQKDANGRVVMEFVD